MKTFEEKILGIIEKFSYEFYVIKLNTNVQCTCVDYTTKQANPDCKKCLGTGYKISIKLISGAMQETDIPANIKPTGKLLIARLYFIDVAQLELGENDIIIDGDKAFHVYESRIGRGFHGKEVYQKALACSKKLESKSLLKNFNEKIGR